MTKTLIDEKDRYCFERITGSTELSLGKDLTTVFIHSGEAKLNLDGLDSKIPLKAGQGFIVTPGTRFQLDSDNAVAYMVSSEVENEVPIIEIIDDGTTRREVPVQSYRVITDPKRVSKPWGHELWVSWFRDYHVMKQIGMTAGSKSSLQFHREKLETNYLQEGKAVVVDGYSLDPQAPEEEVKQSSAGVDFDQYKKTITPGMHWTSKPGAVHRVIAEESYVAYEVSTPELDDVIRLKDETERPSGRIDSEHNNGGKK